MSIYLDNHATSRIDDRVLEEMLPYLREQYGNASSTLHRHGMEAASAVERSRRTVAELIGARPEEIFFTSGATESNNIALRGIVAPYRGVDHHVVTSSIEHSSVLDVVAHMARTGTASTTVRSDASGLVDPDDVARVLTADTVLVSIMHANNEVGSVQSLCDISTVCREKRIPLHTDAAQSIGRIPFHVDHLGVDVASISAHKIHGPKGVGALYVRSISPRVRVAPITFGGGHESGLRPGTLNVAGIVGLAAALRLAIDGLAPETSSIRERRDRLWTQVSDGFPPAQLNGPRIDLHTEERLPNNLNVWFPGAQATMLLRDARIVEASTGSACTNATTEPSHVLMALHGDRQRASESIRLGLSRCTTDDDVDRAANALCLAANRLAGRGFVA